MDVFKKIIFKLQKKVLAGATTLLVKVKAHKKLISFVDLNHPRTTVYVTVSFKVTRLAKDGKGVAFLGRLQVKWCTVIHEVTVSFTTFSIFLSRRALKT